MDRPIVRSGFRMTRRLWIALGIVAAAALGITIWLAVPDAGSLTVDAGDIRTGRVVRAPFHDNIPLRAEVAPLETVLVTAIVGGQVTKRIGTDGDMVFQGAPLVTLSNPEMELEVASRAADITGRLSDVGGQRVTVQNDRQDSDGKVAEARNALARAQRELSNKQFLFDKGIVTTAAIAPLRDEVAFRREQLARAQSGSSEQRATVSRQNVRIDETERQLQGSLSLVRGSLDALTVKAPVTGRLTAFSVQLGQAIKPGDPVGQIDSEGQWKLTADVDQFHLGRVAPGQRAVADVGGRQAVMTVSKVLPEVANGRFRVEMQFAGAPPTGLNRGQVVNVRLVLGADQTAVVAPAGSWLDGAGTSAWVLNAAGDRAQKRAIAAGRRNSDQVEILSGLAPGARIVTSPTAAYAAYDTLYIKGKLP